jgi:hypothetical protein
MVASALFTLTESDFEDGVELTLQHRRAGGAGGAGPGRRGKCKPGQVTVETSRPRLFAQAGCDKVHWQVAIGGPPAPVGLGFLFKFRRTRDSESTRENLNSRKMHALHRA